MGNCCGSQSALDDDLPSHGNDGRSRYQAVSQPQKPRFKQSAGHTLGSGGESTAASDARAAAALAAEVLSFPLGDISSVATVADISFVDVLTE
jgi:hypothetical protein